MAHERLEVFSGPSTNIRIQVNKFLNDHAGNIEVINFQVVDNSANVSNTSSDGNQVLFLMYRQLSK